MGLLYIYIYPFIYILPKVTHQVYILWAHAFPGTQTYDNGSVSVMLLLELQKFINVCVAEDPYYYR